MIIYIMKWDTGDIKADGEFLDFKSKKIKMNLNYPIRSEQKAESSEVLQNVIEERKHIYQATVVRIMKNRKVSF